MSTIDVVEQHTLFTGAPWSSTSHTEHHVGPPTNPIEMVWLVVLLTSALCLSYTFLKRKS